MIKTTVIGNLGQDANVNNVNGKNVINFSLAHTEKFKDASGVQREKTIWLSCAYWTDRTAIAPYLKKGVQVFVEGQPEPVAYSDKQGKPQVDFKLRVASIQLLGGNRENQGGQAGYAQQTGNPQGVANGNYQNSNPNENVDDLPF